MNGRRLRKSGDRSKRVSRPNSFERLDHRNLLAGDSLDALPELGDTPSPMAAEVEPQYEIKHPPRLQLGNAPLAGTPAFDGHDQAEIIWQTISAGNGAADTFVVEYRKVGAREWSMADLNTTVDTNVATRVMHSATIRGLDWSTNYEYRVHHLRAGQTLGSYQHRFQTRT